MPERGFQPVVHINPNAANIIRPKESTLAKRRSNLRPFEGIFPVAVPMIGFDAMLYLRPPPCGASALDYEGRLSQMYYTVVGDIPSDTRKHLFTVGRIPQIEEVIAPDGELRSLMLNDCVLPVRLWRNAPGMFDSWAGLFDRVSALKKDMAPITHYWQSKNIGWQAEARVRVYTEIPAAVRYLLAGQCSRFGVDLGVDAYPVTRTYHQ
jgi:hypothetical protein